MGMHKLKVSFPIIKGNVIVIRDVRTQTQTLMSESDPDPNVYGPRTFVIAARFQQWNSFGTSKHDLEGCVTLSTKDFSGERTLPNHFATFPIKHWVIFVLRRCVVATILGLLSVTIIPNHFWVSSRVFCIMCIEILFHILLNKISVWNLRLL